jgi:hypothetical protein
LNVLADLAEAMKELDGKKENVSGESILKRWTTCIDCCCSWAARTTGLFKHSTSKTAWFTDDALWNQNFSALSDFHKQDSKLCFLSEPVAFRGFTVLEVLLTDQWESNQWQSVSATIVMPHQLSHEGESRRFKAHGTVPQSINGRPSKKRTFVNGQIVFCWFRFWSNIAHVYFWIFLMVIEHCDTQRMSRWELWCEVFQWIAFSDCAKTGIQLDFLTAVELNTHPCSLAQVRAKERESVLKRCLLSGVIWERGRDVCGKAFGKLWSR